MKKQEKKSPFWKPSKEGDRVSGVISGFQQTKTPDGKAGIAIIVDGLLVPLSHQLRTALLDKIPSMKLGKDKLAVTFIERKKLGKGRSVNVMEIALNGKTLESSNFKTMNVDETLAALAMQGDASAVTTKGRRK